MSADLTQSAGAKPLPVEPLAKAKATVERLKLEPQRSRSRSEIHGTLAFGASGLAALTSHLVHPPLYTLKSHMMMHGKDFRVRTFVSNALHTRGMFLYRGLVSRSVGIMPEKALKMQAWVHVGNYMENHGIMSLPKYLVAGSAAGAATTVLGCPSERIMVLAHIRKQGVLHVAREIGFKGMYQGWRVTLYRDICFNAIFFTTRDMLVDYFSLDQPSNSLRFFCGLVGGTLAATITCPLDVAKTRIQGAKLGSLESEQSTLAVMRDIVNKQGVRYLFKGLLPRVYVVPSMMSFFYLLDENYAQFILKTFYSNK